MGQESMEHDAIELAVIAAIFLLAGGIKGAIGLGLPTVSMGLMGAWLPAAEAAALLVLPAFLTNVWQMLDGPYLARCWRRLWPMIVTLAVFAVIGTAVITGARNALTLSLLGLMLIVFGILSLRGTRFRVRSSREPALGLAVGTSTGLITGATAVFVIPSVLYIQALEFDKTEFTQAIALTALTATVGLAAGLGLHGHFAVVDIALPGVCATLAAFAGMAGGQAMRRRVPVETFRRWVLCGLIALGAAMILRAAAS